MYSHAPACRAACRTRRAPIGLTLNPRLSTYQSINQSIYLSIY